MEAILYLVVTFTLVSREQKQQKNNYEYKRGCVCLYLSAGRGGACISIYIVKYWWNHISEDSTVRVCAWNWIYMRSYDIDLEKLMIIASTKYFGISPLLLDDSWEYDSVVLMQILMFEIIVKDSCDVYALLLRIALYKKINS